MHRKNISLPYSFVRALRMIKRNGLMSVASVIILSSSVVVIGCFALIMLNINKGLKEIDAMNQIYVFVDSGKGHTEGETVKLPAAPEASDAGKNFLGWSTEAGVESASYRPGAVYTVNPDDARGGIITFYAVWDGETSYDGYTVRYSSCGKKINSELSPDTVYTEGEKIESAGAVTPYNSSDEFLGWSLEPGSSKADIKPGGKYTVSADDAKGGVITFYAVWKDPAVYESYGITYEMCGVEVAEVPTSESVKLDNVREKLELLGGVTVSDFITKNETLENEKKNFSEYPGLLQLLNKIDSDDNPYPDTYVLTYSEKSFVSDIEEDLSVMERNNVITGYKCRVDIANKIHSLKNAVTATLVWFSIILLIVSIFVIMNTIKLALTSHSKEISTVRYMGATKLFISLQFHIEGILIGAISGLCAYGLDWFVYSYIERNAQIIEMVNPIPFTSVKIPILVLSLVIGIITSWIGSIISIKKYIRI